MPSDKIEKISPQGLQTALEKLNDWQAVNNDNAIFKSFKFKDFAQAWAFMSRIATLAEDMNHHPEWSNIYNRVEITLTTHDAGGISERDIAMAQKIDEYSA